MLPPTESIRMFPPTVQFWCADVFLKYLHRNSVNMPGMVTHIKAPEQQVKSEYSRAPAFS